MGKKAHSANKEEQGAVIYTGRITGSLQGRVLKSGGVCFIADVQFAESDRKSLQDNLEKRRMYTQTMGTFTRSMKAARRAGASSLVLLGDQVDDRDVNGDLAAAKVLSAAEGEFKDSVGYLLGNHDTKWTQTFREARRRSPVKELPGCFAWECEVRGEDDSRWAFLALDCYATGFAAEPGWGKQLPMNGEIGAEQLAWLRGRLRAAKDAGKLAVVLSHVPLHPSKTSPVRGHEAVRRVLEEAGNVKLCLAGHDHPGLFHEDGHGIHYWTDQACLFCTGEPEVAGLVLRLFGDRAEISKLSDDSIHVVPYPPRAGTGDNGDNGDDDEAQAEAAAAPRGQGGRGGRGGRRRVKEVEEVEEGADESEDGKTKAPSPRKAGAAPRAVVPGGSPRVGDPDPAAPGGGAARCRRGGRRRAGGRQDKGLVHSPAVDPAPAAPGAGAAGEEGADESDDGKKEAPFSPRRPGPRRRTSFAALASDDSDE